MRKLSIGALVGVLALVFAGLAYALTNNTVDYSSTIKQKVKGTKKKPANVQYTGVLAVGTTDGSQPNTAPLTELFLAKQLKLNGSRFPSCKQSDIDGKPAFPAKCKKAIIGGGTAHAQLGQPGSQSSVPQDLTVKAVNGPKGKSIMLVVSNAQIPNRVINGPISKRKGPFGLKVGFKVPPELQSLLGNQIALTNFNVKLAKAIKLRVGGRKKRPTSIIQITGCPKSHNLPTRATVHFNNDDGSPGGPVITDNSTMTCK